MKTVLLISLIFLLGCSHTHTSNVSIDCVEECIKEVDPIYPTMCGLFCLEFETDWWWAGKVGIGTGNPAEKLN